MRMKILIYVLQNEHICQHTANTIQNVLHIHLLVYKTHSKITQNSASL
jgi:hypothetical protein